MPAQQHSTVDAPDLGRFAYFISLPCHCEAVLSQLIVRALCLPDCNPDTGNTRRVFILRYELMGYPIERLLRHPVEVYSSAVSMSTALLLATSPHLLMITPSVAYWSAGLLSLGGGVRPTQGVRIIHYQNGLRRLPYFTLKPDEIPVSQKKLYLGMGYRWLQPHVQRLRDIRLAGVQHYVEPGWLYIWVRQKEVDWEARPLMKHLIPITSSHSRLNPVRPYPAVGGKPEIHAVGLLEKEKPVFMDLGERVGHTLILGTMRVGKTRLAEILITQDIRRGEVVIVFDPKGDAHLMARCYVEAKRAGRLCYIMHLGHPEYSARYNAIGNFERHTEIAGRVSDQLPSAGNSAAFKKLAWRFINIVAGAMVVLGDRPTFEFMSQSSRKQLPISVSMHSRIRRFPGRLAHPCLPTWHRLPGVSTSTVWIMACRIPQMGRNVLECPVLPSMPTNSMNWLTTSLSPWSTRQGELESRSTPIRKPGRIFLPGLAMRRKLARSRATSTH
jgi:hypothetical protein